MLLLLLPLLLNPIGLLAKWMPLIYLSSWPLIMENQGRETLTQHALLLILFIVTCDLSRQLMLNLIGFDLMSLPAGISVLLLALATKRGSFVLGLIQPVFSGLMYLSEPAFLVIEVYLLINLVRSFNKWLADQANERDSGSRSLAQWEEPLSRKAIVARVAVILITLACYLGTYLVIRESKFLVEAAEGTLTINFTHAIAILTSLQLISLSLTVYKDDGVISETAMISLLASLPILLAAWSYSNLKSQSTPSATKSTSGSGLFFGDDDDNYSSSRSAGEWSWAAYFPFSMLAGPHSGLFTRQSADELSPFSILWAAFQRAAGQWTQGGGGGGGAGRSALFGDTRGPKLDTDLFGLLLHKLAHYYSGPDLCAVLLCRLLCLACWCSSLAAGSGHASQEVQPGSGHVAANAARSIGRRWPLSRAATIKILLVLTYAQMLTQQMDNRHQLELWRTQATLPSAPATLGDTGAPPEAGESWLWCVWSSARACVSRATGSATNNKPVPARSLQDLFGEASQQLAHLCHLLVGGLEQVPSVLASLGPVWFARWRSVIIQRLLQSGLVQLAYVGSSLLAAASD